MGSGKRHLEHFCGDSVAGGRREETPGTLSQGFRGRWEADETPDTLSREFRARWTTRGATWNAFIGKPWQVGSRKMPPDTLSREFRGRWTAGKDTWNAFAGIPWQVGGRK